MAKYAVVANSNFANPNRYERQSALEFIEKQNHGFILCDEFDIAISTFLEKCVEFLPRDWHRVRTISEAIQEEYIEGDENDIDALNNMEEQIDKMLEDKKARYIDVYTATETIHDYRLQRVKDIPSFGKNVVLKLRKRRYRCPHCCKRFYEDNTFLPRYHHMTNRLVEFILYRLTDERSFTSVTREVNLSVSTVIRVFDLVSYPKAELPEYYLLMNLRATLGEKNTNVY